MEVARHIADGIAKQFCKNLNLFEESDLSSFDLKVSVICQNIFAHYPNLNNLVNHIQLFAERALIDFLITNCYDLFVGKFPLTKPTILVFRQLMQCNDWYGRDSLALELAKQIDKNLLHIGVNTSDILKGYAAAVESLALFDASFVLVHRVCRPIRDYVKARPDTMRTIIKYITTEKPGDTVNATNKLSLILNEEQLVNVNDEYVIAADDNADDRWFDWRPDPEDADPRESRLYRESADVFNMLVSVYGSKDLFVKEYEKLLAERLRTNDWGKHLHAESMYLGTMSKRFTQGELNNCEVMIRDIRESSNFAKDVIERMPFPVSAKVISRAFWPEFASTNYKIDSRFGAALAEFERFYSGKKHARCLHWLPGYGSCVELELEIDSVRLNIEAPVLNVQVLMPFLEKERLNLDELSAGCGGLSETELKRCLEWWCEKGVLVRRNLDASLSESFSITDNVAHMQQFARQLAEQKASDGAMLSDDEDEEEIEEIPIEMQVEELEQYWLYTKNFINFQSTTEQPVTLARLASVYKNIVSPGKPGPSTEAISLFMQQKVRQNLVILENGAYKPTAESRKM